MMNDEYLVIYEHPEGARNWSAYVPDLPGCVATGKTQDECASNISGAIKMHIRGMNEDGETVPRPSTFGTVRVAA